jgi:hypothetical protein
MKTPDISTTPLVRRYGVRGARLFTHIWFPMMYTFLIVVAAGFFAAISEFESGRSRILVCCVAAGLLVLAAFLLTRMRHNFLAAVERLEKHEKSG